MAPFLTNICFNSDIIAVLALKLEDGGCGFSKPEGGGGGGANFEYSGVGSESLGIILEFLPLVGVSRDLIRVSKDIIVELN